MLLATEREIQSSYRDRQVAERYVAERFVGEPYRLLHERQVAAVQEVIDRVRPQQVLEIAPGPGRLTRELRPAGQPGRTAGRTTGLTTGQPGRLTCLEYNVAMIEQGMPACGGRAEWVRGNGFHLPFRTCFDLVYSFRFVRHFYRSDRDRLYREIRRVLRPGGRFIMDAVNERVSRPLREASPEEYHIHDELYRPAGLAAELREAGFEMERLTPVQKCYAWQHRSQVFLGPRANWLNRLVVRGLERLPVRDGLEWIVTCRRV